MRLPTVRIKADSRLGYMIINESDFDPSIHKPYKLPEETRENGEEARTGNHGVETTDPVKRGRPHKKTEPFGNLPEASLTGE